MQQHSLYILAVRVKLIHKTRAEGLGQTPIYLKKELKNRSMLLQEDVRLKS